MSHFVSKRMTCVPETVFSGLMLAVSLFRREGDKASLQCFIFRVQIGTVGEGSVGMCWLAAEGRAGSLSLESLEVWVCNFMGFLFFHQTFKQECSLLMAVCFDFSLLAK